MYESVTDISRTHLTTNLIRSSAREEADQGW